MSDFFVIINKQKISDIESYRLESDIFQAGDAFEINIAKQLIQVKPGDRIQAHISGELVFNGIVDSVNESVSKFSHGLTLSGRDLMGLLVDTHLETFNTTKDIELSELAEDLLFGIPFVDIKNVVFSDGDKNKIIPLESKQKNTLFDNSDYSFVQIEPGDTVFDVLNMFARARGLIFFSMPDGTFVFGRPKTKGKPVFSFLRKKNQSESIDNNIISGSITEDISQQYSDITVVGQQQGTNLFGESETNIDGEATNDGFPFEKPFVGEVQNDGVDPDSYARLILEQQKFEGFKLEYQVPGHLQAGQVYQVNTICHVEDEAFYTPVLGDFLIYSRVFEGSKNSGTTTTLSLSKLGVLPA